MLTVCMIGMGYIGLPTAAIMAQSGLNVVGVDKNLDVVNSLNEGKAHIVEPHLPELVSTVVADGKLKVFSDCQPADVFVIAVPTPVTKTKNADLTYVFNALEELSEHLQEGNLLILESTSPPGTTDRLIESLKSKRPDLFKINGSGDIKFLIDVAHCPERVLPGNILNELKMNNRIIGAVNEKSFNSAKRIYGYFVEGEIIRSSSPTSAELSKLVENSYRDVNLAFANELSMLCDHLNVSVNEIIQLANKHPRVNILTPGVGVGGHCIPVDPWFIVDSVGETAKLIKTARQINDFKPIWAMAKIENKIKALAKLYGRNPKICIFGLTYKPDVDDVRESPALQVYQSLKDKYQNDVICFDPLLHENEYRLDHDNIFNRNIDYAIKLVDHAVFANVDFTRFEHFDDYT